MRVGHFDRKGRPLTLEAWAELFEDMEYKRVGETLIEPWRVSTVWLGLDHNFGEAGPPLIFETMIFPHQPTRENFQRRYATLRQAIAGHAETVAAVRAGRLPASLPLFQDMDPP